MQVRSKEPYILVGLESDSKFSDADMAGEVGAAVAETLLNTKSGETAGAAMLSTWITTWLRQAEGAEDGRQLLEGRRLSCTKVYDLFVQRESGNGESFRRVGRSDNHLSPATLAISVVDLPALRSGPDEVQHLHQRLVEPSVRAPDADVGYEPSKSQDCKPDTKDAAWTSWVAKAGSR